MKGQCFANIGRTTNRSVFIISDRILINEEISIEKTKLLCIFDQTSYLFN